MVAVAKKRVRTASAPMDSVVKRAHAPNGRGASPPAAETTRQESWDAGSSLASSSGPGESGPDDELAEPGVVAASELADGSGVVTGEPEVVADDRAAGGGLSAEPEDDPHAHVRARSPTPSRALASGRDERGCLTGPSDR